MVEKLRSRVEERLWRILLTSYRLAMSRMLEVRTLLRIIKRILIIKVVILIACESRISWHDA